MIYRLSCLAVVSGFAGILRLYFTAVLEGHVVAVSFDAYTDDIV